MPPSVQADQNTGALTCNRVQDRMPKSIPVTGWVVANWLIRPLLDTASIDNLAPRTNTLHDS